jgi:hypothetical protein
MIVVCVGAELGPHGGCRFTAAAMINQCENLHCAKIVSSCSYFSFFAPTTAVQHAIMMLRMRIWLKDPFRAKAARLMAPMPAAMVSVCVFKLVKVPCKNTHHNNYYYCTERGLRDS